MKLLPSYCLLLLLHISSSLSAAMATHQDEEKAFKILDYINQHPFQATFTYSSQSGQHALEEEEAVWKGKLIVQGNQYRLTLQDQEVISNGQTVWTYLKDVNEVQITDHDPEQDAAIPWRIFAYYRQYYALVRLDTHQIDGQVYDVIELVSTNEENELLKLIITVTHATKHIKSLAMYDDNHTLHVLSVTDFRYKPNFDATCFQFNPQSYQGIEIIDMR